MPGIIALMLILGLAAVPAQSAAPAQVAVREAGQEAAGQAQAEVVPSLKPKLFTYTSEGRRDPFRDLLAGREIKEKVGPGGLGQLTVDDVNLIGIVRLKDKLTAIAGSPQSFPFYLKIGDKFADGFVLTIGDSQVTLRKTSDRGIPLMRPKDIIKEINPEER